MNELFQQWIEARLTVPGMVSCGVAGPNDANTCRSVDANFPPERMSEILRTLQRMRPVPCAESPTVRWHTWVFANGKIRSATRPDGWTFAAAVRANSDAAQILDPLTEEFITLKSA